MTINLGEGQLAITTNPTGPAGAWHLKQVDTTLTKYGHNPAAMIDVSCPTVKMCVATDDTGHIVASTDPANPKARWVGRVENGGYNILGVDCPTVNACVGSDGFDVLTTIDPIGTEPWQRTQVAPPSSGWIWTVACASIQNCVAVGSSSVYIGTPTPLPSSSQIVASLRHQLFPRHPAKAAARFLKTGELHLPLTAPGAGVLSMTWTDGSRRIASGQRTFPAAGHTIITLKLTAIGKHLLSRHRAHRIRVTALYTPSGGPAAIKTSRTLSFRT
jgi:hypothetical protein